MSDEPYDYDPGTPYDPPPDRRRRRRRDHRRPSEHDDAWAAADDMADEYEDVDPAGLAAGYDWQDSPDYGVNADRRPRRDWHDEIEDIEVPDRRPPRRSGPSRGRPPADLGPLPPEAEEMRRRRDRFSPQDPPEVSRHRDPRTGDRDYHARDDQPPGRRRDITRYGNPNYHRDRARTHEYAEFPASRDRDRRRESYRDRDRYPRSRYPAEPLPQKPKRKPKPKPGVGPLDNTVLEGIPTWQLMIIVAMVIAAFLAVAFTCVMLLTLL